MTLLNTLGNIGSKWTNSTALYLLQRLTFVDKITNKVWLDGYTVELIIATLYGLIWLYIATPTLIKLKQTHHNSWLVRKDDDNKLK